MARRKPRFALPEGWSAAQRRETERVADEVDQVVWELLATRRAPQSVEHKIFLPKEVLTHLQECFPVSRADPDQPVMQVRRWALQVYTAGFVTPDAVWVFADKVGRSMIYYSDLPSGQHEVYVRLRRDRMDPERAYEVAERV